MIGGRSESHPRDPGVSVMLVSGSHQQYIHKTQHDENWQKIIQVVQAQQIKSRMHNISAGTL